jgi:HlyD family secretion protein
MDGSAPAQTATAPRRARAGRRFLVIIVLVIVVAAILLGRGYFSASVPDSLVVLSGRIEGDDAAVSPKAVGRLLEVRVREGDAVNAGDVIAVLDDEQVRAREDQAKATLAQAEARAKSAEDQIAVLQEQLNQALLQTDQSRQDAGGRVQQAEADLAAAEAQLAQQQAAYQLALFDKDAYARLAATGAVSERQSKQATSTADQEAAAVAAAKQHVEAVQGAFATAKANLSNPGIRETETAAVRRHLAQQSAEVSSAQAQTAQARAALVEAQANRQDLIVKAPFTGTVVTRAAEPGEVVMAGTAIVTLVDLTKVYLRGFVPEGRIGAVKVGQPARVYIDSNPNQPIDASVSRIDPQATFTPENTYFRDDRVKQVVGVKLQLKGAVGFAKPGMPADGEILVSGTAWPKGGRWVP